MTITYASLHVDGYFHRNAVAFFITQYQSSQTSRRAMSLRQSMSALVFTAPAQS